MILQASSVSDQNSSQPRCRRCRRCCGCRLTFPPVSVRQILIARRCSPTNCIRTAISLSTIRLTNRTTICLLVPTAFTTFPSMEITIGHTRRRWATISLTCASLQMPLSTSSCSTILSVRLSFCLHGYRHIALMCMRTNDHCRPCKPGPTRVHM